MHSCCHGNIHYNYHLISSELSAPVIVLHVRSNLTLVRTYKILKIKTFFEILITGNLLKCLKDPFARSAPICKLQYSSIFISSDTRSTFCSKLNIICFTCFQAVANFYLMISLYVRMHAFIICYHQLSIGHPKTHPKMIESLLVSVKCPRLYCHLLNVLE